MIPRIQNLLKISETVSFLGRRFNCWTGAISSSRRTNFLRKYPVTLVLPNGSSLKINYPEPRRIIVLPRDLDLLTEEERKAIILKRTTKKKIKVVKEEFDDDFDEDRYLNLVKQ